VSLVELLAAAKQSGDYRAILDAVPYSKFLGLTAALEGETLVTSLAFAPHLVGNPTLPALHGGTLGALLESAAIFELLWRAETVVLPKTITLTVDYLRSAGPQDVHASATITRQGRRVCNVRATAWQADPGEPVAAAHAIFLVMQDG